MRTRKSLLNEMLCLSEVRGELDVSSNAEIEGRLKEIDIEIKNLKKEDKNDISGYESNTICIGIYVYEKW